LLKQQQVTFGIILPYVWTLVFISLVVISFISIKMSFFIRSENLILLTFILSPIVFTVGIIISVITMLKSGLNRNILFAIILNIILLCIWFIYRMSFYIEFNMID
jgi:hypothetical protein